MCCDINLFIKPEVKTSAIKVISFKHIINLLKDVLMRSMVTIDSNDLNSNDFLNILTQYLYLNLPVPHKLISFCSF